MDTINYLSGVMGGFLVGIAVCYAYINYFKKPIKLTHEINIEIPIIGLEGAILDTIKSQQIIQEELH